MRAVVVTEPGGPEKLTIAEVPDLVAGPGELLVRVVAAGVNRADLLQRQGFYPPPKGISDVIGLEVSGRVEAIGEGVEGWAVGDEVVALLAGGGYAELTVVPAGQCCRPPAGVGRVEPRPGRVRRWGVVPRPWRDGRDRGGRHPVREGARRHCTHHGRYDGEA